jgi:hypothetical protein
MPCKCCLREQPDMFPQYVRWQVKLGSILVRVTGAYIDSWHWLRAPSIQIRKQLFVIYVFAIICFSKYIALDTYMWYIFIRYWLLYKIVNILFLAYWIKINSQSFFPIVFVYFISDVFPTLQAFDLINLSQFSYFGYILASRSHSNYLYQADPAQLESHHKSMLFIQNDTFQAQQNVYPKPQ